MVKTRARHVETKSNVKKEQYDDTFKEAVVSLTTSSSECVTQNDNGEKKQSTLLWKWAHHDHSSFHDFETDEATQIRNALLHWYRAHRRKLPWRGDAPPYDGSTAGRTGKTTAQKKKNGNQSTIGKFFATKSQDPSTQLSNKKNSTNNNESQNMMSSTVMEVSAYGVWVSEIMLQQTRVEAVIPFYIKWMESFPTVHALADASEEEVNSHWAGLGFYRRARMLHAGAKLVVEKFNGELPNTVSELTEINGIGPYTASAIASIAFDTCVPVVDGNVCRVLARLRGVCQHIKAPVFKDDIGWRLAKQIVTAGDGKHAGEVNQALMELGATFCAPSGSGIDINDPLKDFYLSTKLGIEFANISNSSMILSLMEGPGACKLCDSSGVSQVLLELSNKLESYNSSTSASSVDTKDLTISEVAAMSVHASIPIAPPKKAKREEVLVVAALSQPSSTGERWLMVKRPKDGLLAGQWEFPSTCLWTGGKTNGSESKSAVKQEKINSKSKVKQGSINGVSTVAFIEPAKRKVAMDKFLSAIAINEMGESVTKVVCKGQRKAIGKAPMEHVFSHVRHTMWVEHGTISVDNKTESVTSWTTEDGREVRWMSEVDMKKVGVTSGVKKVLSGVKGSRLKSNSKVITTKRQKTR